VKFDWRAALPAKLHVALVTAGCVLLTWFPLVLLAFALSAAFVFTLRYIWREGPLMCEEIATDVRLRRQRRQQAEMMREEIEHEKEREAREARGGPR
jgi:hypothetical protein